MLASQSIDPKLLAYFREHADSAVVTGIQIHGPEGRHFVWPGIAHAVVGGERRDLVLGVLA